MFPPNLVEACTKQVNPLVSDSFFLDLRLHNVHNFIFIWGFGFTFLSLHPNYYLSDSVLTQRLNKCIKNENKANLIQSLTREIKSVLKANRHRAKKFES